MYWVRVNPGVDPVAMPRLFDIDENYKLAISIDSREEMHKLRISVAPGMKLSEVMQWANEFDITLLDVRPLPFGLMDIQVNSTSVDEVIRTPWISFIENIPVEEEINFRLINAERGWGLKSSLFRNLDGRGITVGIGDGGRLGVHHDWSRSVLDLASYNLSTHAMQVTGIVTGSGLIDPSFGGGYAPEANVLIRNFSDILWDAPQYVEDFNLSLTNNSYSSNPFDCTYIGDYNGASAGLDAMMNVYPELLHVFAAGNSGTITCSPYPFRFATIAGGYQSAKNVLTVGAILVSDGVTNFSSRGPVDDGRLKPEVVAYGADRYTTTNNHLYTTNSGTSFSSPATMGLATLLSERYKQLHNDSMPGAALLKNIICNSADDMGLAGPDFQYGFGRINGVRAAEIMEAGQYDSVVVHQGSTILRSFSVPPGVASVDIMLLWTDHPAAPYETVTLVNDLDMLLVDPSGDTLRPWKLNYTPVGVTVAATTGADHVNNYEQITVASAEEGLYTIIIKGFRIPMGPQAAWLSWDLHQAGIKVQSPNGGETFRSGEPQYLRWDAYGTGTSTFSSEYSIDGGSNWLPINSTIGASVRHLAWTIPNTPTDLLSVRISATNGMKDTSDLNAMIMSAPTNLVATSPCNGYLSLSWNAVAGADYYRVFTIKDEMLIELDTTSNLSFISGGFKQDVSSWMTVAGVFTSGKNGMRARALSVTADGGNTCGWDHDLRLDSLLSPVSGRQLTASALSSSEQIEIFLTNAGQLNASGFTLSYQVNNNPVVSEIFPGTINAGTGQYVTFSQPADFSPSGEYDVKIWSTYATDPFMQNDTLKFTIEHLPNAPVVLPWIEDFETVADTIIGTTDVGIASLTAWDAILADDLRVRTFAGSPFCHSGDRALTMDASKNISAASGDVFLTMNLENYFVETDDIRMNLFYMHHEIIPDVTNTESIWVRGSDSDTFVLVTYLDNPASLRGMWQHITGLEISDVLQQAGQEFSSSFQVKFPFKVSAAAGDTEQQDGQTIDLISFQKINLDLKAEKIIFPESISCGLGLENIVVAVTNTSSKKVPNTSISYRINNGIIYTTNVGTVNADTTIHYILSPVADFAAEGVYDLVFWVSSPTDDFQQNDTFRTTILHLPLIDVYPYREGFEEDNAGWFAAGIHSTWSHGTPGKGVISRAAEGQKVWITGLTGPHNADEESYLYSPCFDLHTLTEPYLSFAIQYQLELNYDYARVEYRLEGSDQWIKLGAQGGGTHWYNHATNNWSGDQLKWITCGIAIPFSDTLIQFRWVMQSDVGVEYEGIAIDQINLYDRAAIYDGVPLQIIQPVSGNDWVHIDQGGQRIFSIHPQGQDLGSVTLSLFKSNQTYLTGDSLYLLSRNWVVSNSNGFTGEIKLRGYFTSVEANHLIAASGCAQCISARDGFDGTALKYSGIDEDGLYSNNEPTGVTSFSNDSIYVFPYENGYYAEWNTDSLSEWWISSPVTKMTGTIARSITSSGDDAEQHQDNGSVNPVGERLTLTDKNGYQKIGWRFRNITIPSGSYITSATLKLTASEDSSLPANWILQSQITADASGFTTSKYNISLRQRSEQIVQWVPSLWNTDTEYSSPDIKHLIQQVIDQSSWINGNDLVLIMNGIGDRGAWSYDGDPLKSAMLFIGFNSICSDSGILYVDKDATGLQNGVSWSNAYPRLEQALDRALHCSGINQIWIAEGIYSPYTEVSRSFGFTIPPGVSLFGGFQGTESSIGERIFGMYPTTLSGDIGIPMVAIDNLYHVVTILQGNSPVLLDGISIREGMANGPSPSQQTGGGIFNQGIVHCHHVLLESNSFPALYNAPGAELQSTGMLEIKQ